MTEAEATASEYATVGEGATDFAAQAAEFRRLRPTVPVVADLHLRMSEAIAAPGALDMGNWHHSCGTTHCRAGWAITLAGAAGAELEAKVGPAAAGGMIYRASTGMWPDFYTDNETARADIERCAKES